MMLRRRQLAVLLGSLPLLPAAAAVAAEPAAAILERQTRELLDAITPGTVAVWARLLDDDAIYTDENGLRFSKREMLATQIHPLPPPLTGHLGPVDLVVRVHGDVGIVTYDIDEHEDYHGAQLHAIYRVTDSWIRRKQGWRLLASQIMAVPHDPAAVTLPVQLLDEYVGSYALRGETYAITRDGDAIAGSRNGGAPQKLSCELRDVFFTPGRPRSRKLFRRDANGRVAGFVDRREGEDIAWVRNG